MRHRKDQTPNLFGHHLSVRRETAGGRFWFSGFLDGRQCVSARTREAAIQALLRRATHASAIF